MLPLSCATGNIYLFRGNAEKTSITTESLQYLKKRLAQLFPTETLILEWDAKHHPPSSWNERDICIFPGGVCSEWNKTLSSHQQKKILSWVRQGGIVIGICAGAYFCSQQSEFNTEVGWIKTVRTISLFEGICKGPLFSDRIEIVKVCWEATKKEGYAVVIKGGEFIVSTDDAQVTVLARFIDKSNAIATIMCRNGTGKSILSSVHWELAPKV